MLRRILESHTDEGFGRNVYQKCFSLSIYKYIYASLVSSFTICIKVEICTQKKHMLVKVSAKAFISITFQNQMEHTYR